MWAGKVAKPVSLEINDTWHFVIGNMGHTDSALSLPTTKTKGSTDPRKTFIESIRKEYPTCS